ncbi:nucleotidyltransferase family protein [Pseudoduganella sp. S-14]|uniref:nucleotidyltransferase family protein n=1 Tax=Pseudoduganella sp. S-14 TaxID=3404065 RepID=UPI003CF16F94
MHGRFRADVLANRNNRVILERWAALDLPDCWLVAGCLFQTVWNLQAGRAPEADIKDYDLFYFDQTDLSEQGEQDVQERVDGLFADLGVPIEVANQARVHTWYESYFGHPYPALHSAREGIDRFLMPATCVGIRPDAIYAPNGLEILYKGLLAPNSLTPYRELFEQKAASYLARWPSLRVMTH